MSATNATLRSDHREHTALTEKEAHRKRREYIDLGFAVSLVAFDPSRNRYVYDVLL